MIHDLSREFGNDYNEELLRQDEANLDYGCGCQFCECAWKLYGHELSGVPPEVSQWRHKRNLLPMLIAAAELDPHSSELEIAQLKADLEEANRPENVYSNDCKRHSPFPLLADLA